MFKNYYTTAMSGGGKTLEKRFKNIVRTRKTSRLRNVTAAIIMVAAAFSTLFASATLADTVASHGAGDIAVLVNGNEINLTSKPFEDNYEVYVPLRETLNACGVADENITYLNGRIDMTLHSDVTGGDYTAHINIGAQNIAFDGDAAKYKLVDGARTTTHPALLKDGVTYVPIGMMSRIKQYDIEIEDEAQYLKDFRYNRALPVKLLKGLTVRKYDESGFDVVLADWTTAQSHNPEDYYENGEKVIIGNWQKQEEQGYLYYAQTNWYNYPLNAVKRIVTDDEGRVLGVVMVENQKHEAINGSGLSSEGWSSGWEYALSDNSLIIPGEGSYADNTGVFRPGTNPTEPCFYIPVELIAPPYEN